MRELSRIPIVGDILVVATIEAANGDLNESFAAISDAIEAAENQLAELKVIIFYSPKFDSRIEHLVDHFQQLRKEEPLAYVLVTDSVESEQLKRLITAGVHSFVIGPFTDAHLRAKVEEAKARVRFAKLINPERLSVQRR
jgi:AmiR/NasT family two-component response regulator